MTIAPPKKGHLVASWNRTLRAWPEAVGPASGQQPVRPPAEAPRGSGGIAQGDAGAWPEGGFIARKSSLEEPCQCHETI